MTDAKAALLIIDVQTGLDDPRHGARNNPDAESRMAELLAAWRARGLPIVHVQHMSTRPESLLRPGLPGNAIKPEVRPLEGETLFRKSVNSAFVGTGVEAHLRERGVHTVVITGLTTDHCVSASARSAANLGFDVIVVADATATFEREGHDGTHYTAEQMHGVELASLHGEFATVRTAAEVIAALPGTV